MDEEIKEYQNYLFNFGMIEKPLMPKFDLLAYTDNEYLYAINSIMEEFKCIDDFQLTINYLRGE